MIYETHRTEQNTESRVPELAFSWQLKIRVIKTDREMYINWERKKEIKKEDI